MERFQSLGEVLAAFRRRLWLLIALIAIGCVVSVAIGLNTERVYEATAVVQIEDPRVTEEIAGLPDEDGDRAVRRVQLIEQRLMSRDTLLEVMDEYDLFTAAPDMPVSERLVAMRRAVSVRAINNTVTGQRMDTPSGIYITARLRDADKAAAVANDLMSRLIEQSRSRAANRAEETLTFFQQEEREVRREIDSLEASLAAFKRENARQLPEGLSSLRFERADLRRAMLEIEREILSLSGDSGRAREEVQQRRIALLEEQRSLLSARLSEIESLIASAPDVEREVNAMERELSQLQEEFAVISRRKAEAELGQVLEEREQGSRFEVLETALVPDLPVSRSRRSVAAMGGAASVVIAVTLVFLLELLQPVIRTAGQMERSLGVAPVVAIPKVGPGGRRARRAPSGTGWITGALGAVAAMLTTLLTR